MSHPVLAAIRSWLTTQGVPFDERNHAPTYTSEESAAARGEALNTGGKALLLRCDRTFGLFVLPADRKLDSAAIRKTIACKKLRFATPEELKEQTGLVPGCVPPFGEPILPYALHVDSAILENDKIAFNAGSLTDSIIMQVADYLRVAQPVRTFEFSALRTDAGPSVL
ncbi:MAG: hypothetical protein NT069_25285 [Planctomycetota bacterium]|nr:hypothetical protein [Planctomycetota bacterium]